MALPRRPVRNATRTTARPRTGTGHRRGTPARGRTPGARRGGNGPERGRPGRGRPVRGGASKSNPLIWAGAGGGVLVILILVVAVAMSSGDDGDKGKKKGKKANAADTGSGGSTTSGSGTPRDIRSRDLPPSKDVPKLKAELKSLKGAFPADIKSVTDEELQVLVEQWGAFLKKCQQSDYSGYPNSTRSKIMGPVKLNWQRAREERDRREDERKGSN